MFSFEFVLSRKEPTSLVGEWNYFQYSSLTISTYDFFPLCLLTHTLCHLPKSLVELGRGEDSSLVLSKSSLKREWTFEI